MEVQDWNQNRIIHPSNRDDPREFEPRPVVLRRVVGSGGTSLPSVVSGERLNAYLSFRKEV